MKMFVTLPKLITAVAVVFSSVLANAAEKTVNCTVGFHKNGVAQITILPVEGHPELALLKVELNMAIVNPGHPQVGKTVYLSGLLAAQIVHDGSYLGADGELRADMDKGAWINSQAVSLQGSISKDGSMFLQLMDTDRVLQHGYGVFLECR